MNDHRSNLLNPLWKNKKIKRADMVTLSEITAENPLPPPRISLTLNRGWEVGANIKWNVPMQDTAHLLSLIEHMLLAWNWKKKKKNRDCL